MSPGEFRNRPLPPFTGMRLDPPTYRERMLDRALREWFALQQQMESPKLLHVKWTGLCPPIGAGQR